MLVTIASSVSARKLRNKGAFGAQRPISRTLQRDLRRYNLMPNIYIYHYWSVGAYS